MLAVRPLVQYRQHVAPHLDWKGATTTKSPSSWPNLPLRALIHRGKASSNANDANPCCACPRHSLGHIAVSKLEYCPLYLGFAFCYCVQQRRSFAAAGSHPAGTRRMYRGKFCIYLAIATIYSVQSPLSLPDLLKRTILAQRIPTLKHFPQVGCCISSWHRSRC